MAAPVAHLRQHLASARTFDDLLNRLTPAVVQQLGERPNQDADLSFIPTFCKEVNLTDGGDGWEVISWDVTRRAVIRRDAAGRWTLEVRPHDR